MKCINMTNNFNSVNDKKNILIISLCFISLKNYQLHVYKSHSVDHEIKGTEDGQIFNALPSMLHPQQSEHISDAMVASIILQNKTATREVCQSINALLTKTRRRL